MPDPVKLLIIDDEASVRLVLNRFLTTSGFRVTECPDGADAIEQVRREKPALIILDVDMPRLNGWDTLIELRRHGCRLPVLMLTRDDDIPSRIKGLEAGADDYVGKPCDLLELLARIKALLRRSRIVPAGPFRLRFDDLVIDMERKSARRGRTAVSFTRTDYALLDLFAQYHGKPVSRELMRNVVWGATDSPNSHTLDTCLWRLRRKLGDAGREPPWIRNLPGIGYVLECELESSSEARV